MYKVHANEVREVEAEVQQSMSRQQPHLLHMMLWKGLWKIA